MAMQRKPKERNGISLQNKYLWANYIKILKNYAKQNKIADVTCEVKEMKVYPA